ncbi:CGNR zinc finger domain-containing protein [Kitasatospora sp. NPDC057223]|uniref:CGNR zinc finger domain-containing protein n=1 Tax=Kitasatospora sp. NPDC057223 TaxID=3346055 RepID=UPI00363FB985
MQPHSTLLTKPADDRETLLDLALGGPAPGQGWRGAGTGPQLARTPHPQDRRPLLGEPLALDLLNTRWDDAAGPADLLADPDGYRIWLAGAGLAGLCDDGPDALTATRHAREILAAALAAPHGQRPADAGREAAVQEINRVLAHGALRSRLTAHGPETTVEVGDPAWLAAWLAVDDYLQLLCLAPGRIRSCAGRHLHPRYFYDTSRNGLRRWCSMAECGNRAKAARHYRRGRGGPAPAGT